MPEAKTTITPIDFFKDYESLQPSLFRESHNLHKILKSIFGVYEEQQDKLLWLADNILNIDKAEKSHLDFIGSLVGQDRLLVDFDIEYFFGFDGAYHSDTFGAKDAPYVGSKWRSRSYFNSATSRRLTDDEYRRLIKARVINNQSNCASNDLLEVINLITGDTTNYVQRVGHGHIKIKTADKTGLLSYFVDRLHLLDNILPIAAGVSVSLENIYGEEQLGKDMVEFVNLLSKLVNVDLPFPLISDSRELLEILVNEDLPSMTAPLIPTAP